MARVEVQVATADILSGCRCQPGYCPIALAAGRALPTLQVLALSRSLRVKRLGSRETDPEIVVPLPIAAQEFITDFDERHRVRPLAFAIDVPDTLLA